MGRSPVADKLNPSELQLSHLYSGDDFQGSLSIGSNNAIEVSDQGAPRIMT